MDQGDGMCIGGMTKNDSISPDNSTVLTSNTTTPI